ncbi:MAG: hypothetical protein AAB667_01560 [Patescibacteria group bacterium]
MLRRSTTEKIGWLGVIAILAAYISLNFGFLSPKSLVYLILNIAGSLCIITDALRQKDYQPVVLNIIWAAVAVFSIIKALS